MSRALSHYDYARAVQWAKDNNLKIGLADVANGVFYFTTLSGQQVTKTARELKDYASQKVRA